MKLYITNAGQYESEIKELLQETSCGWGEGGVVITLDRCDEGIKITSDGKSITLCYSTVNSLFRGIGVIISKGETDYEVTQKMSVRQLGTMVDCSRNGVMKVDAVKRYINCMASLGLNYLMLYTEDTYEIENRPLFGYLRGRYTKLEIQEMVAYGEKMGVELVPCIQTLGHLRQYLKWGRGAGPPDYTGEN